MQSTPLNSPFHNSRLTAAMAAFGAGLLAFAAPTGAYAASSPAVTPNVVGNEAVAGDIDCDEPGVRCVALTFDDGPGPRTPEVLDALAEHDAKATFFVVGEQISRNPETVRRTHAEGHELGNHTVGHPNLTTLDRDEIHQELAEVQDQIEQATGLTSPAELAEVQDEIEQATGFTPTVMRPPYGATNATVRDVTAELGLAQILWNVDTEDWRDRDADIVAERAISGAATGAIILLHDIHGTTVDAVPTIVETLTERGYSLVTVSQMLGDTEPGQVYYSGARSR